MFFLTFESLQSCFLMQTLKSYFKNIGPGILVAAAGVGAGDMIVGLKAGSQFGMTLLWVVLLTSLLKYVLTEGVARWQLVSGETILESWIRRFSPLLSLAFLFFLILWSFMVGGALISANGLAGHALFPQFSVIQWGVFHALLGFTFVYLGQYQWIENLTKFLIGLMFVIILISAIAVRPKFHLLLQSILPSFPTDATTLIFAIIGGVGGSITMLSYSYWLQEKGWNQYEQIKKVRTDLFIAYALTGLFVIALMIIAASMDIPKNNVSGSQLVLYFAQQMQPVFGHIGVVLFKVGFWGTVFSSLLCVWHGIPYIFCDFVHSFTARREKGTKQPVTTQSIYFRGYLLFITFIPMLLLFWSDAIKNVINYALISAFFAFFLAVMLLYMGNQKQWMKQATNNWITNLLLFLAVLLFLGLFLFKLR